MGVLLNTITSHMLLTRRRSRVFCILIFVSLSAFQGCSTVLIGLYLYSDTFLVKYIIFMITFCSMIYYTLAFGESFFKKLFMMLSIWMISVSIILISTYISGAVMRYFPGEDSGPPIALIKFISELSMRFILLFLCIRMRKSYKHHMQFINDKSVFAMSLYAFAVLLYSYQNFNIASDTNSDTNIGGMLLFVASVLLGYISVGVALISLRRTLALNSNMKIVENQLEFQRENYKSLMNFIEDGAKLKHDLRHHTLALKSMLENENYEKALQYMRQYTQSEMMKDMPVLCGNLTADSLTRYYMGIALNKGIDFQARLNLPEDIGVNPVDLSVILGNSIENAIIACDKLDNGESKYIIIKSDIIGRQLIIKINNSFNGIVNKEGDEFMSTGHDGRGIGITSVKAAADKYEGRVDIQYSSNEFEMDIILAV